MERYDVVSEIEHTLEEIKHIAIQENNLNEDELKELGVLRNTLVELIRYNQGHVSLEECKNNISILVDKFMT